MENHVKQTIKFYLGEAKNFSWVGFFMVTSVIAASTFGVIVPWYFKKFFDILSTSTNADETTVKLVGILVFIAIFSFFEWACWRTGSFLGSYFSSNVMERLANLCFRHLHKHSFSFFNNNFSGSLTRRANKFVWAFDNIADRFLWELLPLVVNVIVILIILWQRNTTITLAIAAWIALILLINWIFISRKLPWDIKRTEADSALTGLLADTIANNANLKLFNGYSREVDRYANQAKKVKVLHRKSWDMSNIFEAIQGFIMSAIEIVIFYLAIKLWQRGLLTIGDFVLIQAYILNIIMRIWGLGRIMQRMFEGFSDAEEMSTILTTPWEITDAKNATKLKVVQGKIEFIDVDFSYHQTRTIIDKLNLTIKPQEKLALVGPSGAGKSTLVKLLLRMHDITGGKILIDDQKISAIAQESLWKNTSLVPQEPILFHRTLLENIRYGKPEATDEEVISAAKLAHCDEFISEFPEGYETYVGERGVKLSGGERQRVAIARAILRNAPILVLDEATSSLDSESEHLIQDALNNLMKGKTVIVIAHRLSTIMKMDRIVIVDQGKIKEEGTHQELLNKKSGLYKRLWEIQAGGFIE